MPKFSILTTLYQSEAFVEEFYSRAKETVLKISDDYEFVFVDDCFDDGAKEKVLKLKERDNRIVLIELSRNFGQLKAIMCGLKHCLGEYVFILDSDLEEKPEVIVDFYNEMLSENLDMVYGQTMFRRRLVMQGFLASVFYKIFNLLADVNIPKNITSLACMNRKYLDSLLQFEETHIFLAGLHQLNGFKQKGILVEKDYKGFSSYNFIRRMSMAIDAIFSFSSVPLYYISSLGILISFFSMCLGLFLIYKKIFLAQVSDGWTSLMVVLLFSCGLIITSIGILGIYIAKIFIQVKHRPNSIIKRIVR
jgi:putative glycosyltransferase